MAACLAVAPAGCNPPSRMRPHHRNAPPSPLPRPTHRQRPHHHDTHVNLKSSSLQYLLDYTTLLRSYSLGQLGTVHYVAALAAGGPHQASAQGLAESLRALGGICANALGGAAMDRLGPRLLYGGSALCVGAALATYLGATVLTPHSRAGRPCEAGDGAGEGGRGAERELEAAPAGSGARPRRAERGPPVRARLCTAPPRSESSVELVRAGRDADAGA